MIAIVLFADQLFKYWVHTHIPLNTQLVVIPNWFILNYIENNGMAFGLEIGGITGKITLTIFRILAVIAIMWYIVNQLKLKSSKGFIVCVSLILAGAIGNIIDSVFYGIIYRSQSLPLFQGRVIDMLYFPIVDTYIPEWFPFWKGEHFEFFRPVFNIADASISIGIIAILLFQKKFFPVKNELNDATAPGNNIGEPLEEMTEKPIEETSLDGNNNEGTEYHGEDYEQKSTEIDSK